MSEEIKNENQKQDEQPKLVNDQPSQQEMAENTKRIQDQRNMILSLAEKSKIKNLFGKTEVVFIDEKRPTKYALELTYPGSVEASDILQQALMENGAYSMKYIMERAIKEVITLPRINSVEDFWNCHTNFGEAATKVFNFLSETSEGDTEQESSQNESRQIRIACQINHARYT